MAGALPDRLRGSGFGALGGIQSAGDVVSSVTVGILYTVVSLVVAFAYAAGWMALSFGASSWLIANYRNRPTVASTRRHDGRWLRESMWIPGVVVASGPCAQTPGLARRTKT